MAERAFTADDLQRALDALDRVFQDNELPMEGVLKEGVLSDELHDLGISRELAKVLVDGLIEAEVFRPDKYSLIEIRERQSSLFGGPTVDMGSRVSRRLHFSRDTWHEYINKEHERRAAALPKSRPAGTSTIAQNPKTSRRRISKEALAIGLLYQDRRVADWTDKQLAERLECHVKSIPRWKRFQSLRELVRQGRPLPRRKRVGNDAVEE
jgi:hypothetical protein